jgi:hypothetical protein
MPTYYPARPDPITQLNLDSMKYTYSISSPKTFDGRFRSHVDLVSEGPIQFDDSWVPLSLSGNTARMMAVIGSELSYTPPNNGPANRLVQPGAICLVNPGPKRGQFTVSVPKDTV